MTSLSTRIAELALSTFEKLPQKCKPRIHPDGNREWTPLSAIVFVFGVNQENLLCVSLATGTKCLPASMMSICQGSMIHDSHAEILALRGMNYWLLTELKRMIQDDEYESKILERSMDQGNAKLETNTSDQERPFQIKDDVSIHLFTTEAPCGDASMELLIKSKDPKNTIPWPEPEDDSLLGRGHFSKLGAVRRKPARGDAEPSLSKSCTDKLTLKQFIGVISFPTDLFIAKTPVTYLRSIIVYPHQYDEISFERAFGCTGRLRLTPQDDAHFFSIDILPPDFPRFVFEKSQNSPSTKQNPQKTSNISALWIFRSSTPDAEILEILLNGIKQGFQRLDSRRQRESVVCRRRMWELGREIKVLLLKYPIEEEEVINKLLQPLAAESYESAKTKSSHQDRNRVKSRVVDHLGNWERNSGDGSWGLPAS